MAGICHKSEGVNESREVAYESWTSLPIMTQRGIAASLSRVGGQGKKRCGCEGMCNN